MTVQLYGGAVLLDSGEVADDAACCCGGGGYDCGPCDSPTTDITVDLGAAGWWTDAKCDYCDQPSGEYVATWWAYGGHPCCWLYFVDDVCQIAGLSAYADFGISVCLLGTTSYTWEVRIWLQDRLAASTGLSEVVYRSTTQANADCWSIAVGGKITLTKFSEQHILGLCTDVAPATITIEQ